MSYKNLALGYIATAPSPATSGTSFVLGSGEGARFPAPGTDGEFYVTVCPADDDPHLGNSEICKVTARSTDTFGTIVRAQRGSSARSIIVGDRVFLGIYIEDLQMGSAPVIGETPSGSVNSSNKSFTTALTFVANSLQVFLNGVRLTRGTDYAEKAAYNGFDIDSSVLAPQTGDILRVNYHTSPQTLVTGSNAFIIETVPGTPNGSTTAFTLSNSPVTGTLEIFRDGQLLEGGGADYTLSGAIVTFVSAPLTGTLLKAKYQQSVSTSGNAATLGGFLPAFFTQLAQGQMINGKIVTSVSSNNLTVAIKTLAGADPSSSDPVYVRVGNTVRAITAALSVTKNAGTNWMNSGAAETATKEIDYFVYIGYNSTDGVVLGFSRFPGARVYSDFSATTTNDRYAGISTITNAGSTDEYEVVGRFNAILSASASYNWSIPATSIIKSRPIFETRWLDWIPTYGGFSANPSTTFAKYKIDEYGMQIMIATGNGTSNASTFTLTLPFNIITGVGNLPVFFYGVDNGSGVTATAPMAFVGATNRLDLYKSAALGTWTSSGNKGAAFEFFFDTK